MIKTIFSILVLTLMATSSFAKDTDYNDQYVQLAQYVPVPKVLDGGITVTTISWSLGSGIFLPNGKILTANHVLKFDAKVDITLANGKVIEGKIESRDPEKDYGIVTVVNPEEQSLPKGRPVSCTPPAVGDNVTWVGHPDGTAFVFSRGYVNKVTHDIIMVDGRVIVGMSGSGVLNDRGEIIGVMVKTTFSQRSPGSSFGLMVPTSVLDIVCPPKVGIK